jgi:hypothetical protein
VIAWLWRLLVGDFCRHQWETINEMRVEEGGRPVGRIYVLRCRECGRITCKTVGPLM